LKKRHLAININNAIIDVNDHGDGGPDSWDDLDFAGAGAIAT
jgi:hypothetical protein